MATSIEQLLGLSTQQPKSEKDISFSFLFFSDVRHDINSAEKYALMRDLTLFADREGFTAVYIPERHFHEFGAIYTNPAIIAANLIPQTSRVRFRTAGISLPLHHPAEIVEWWAMNDILSSGRVDLGFGSGWNKADFILAPNNYHNRRAVCSEYINLVRRLWRGETLSFAGADGEPTPITVYPRPLQKELNVWLLVTSNDEGFIHAGKQGYNIFTMLYGNNLDVMSKKFALYRKAREQAGFDPDTGIITLMLHTLLLENQQAVHDAVHIPFKEYIKSALNAHVKAAFDEKGGTELTQAEKDKMLDYAYQRYFKTGALFGSVADGREMVEQVRAAGVNDIACLVDFGVDYTIVHRSLHYLKQLVAEYV